MPTLTYLGDSYDCATAIKGDDYIHLLDENCRMIAAFDGITDFSGFTLENGSYVAPKDHSQCEVAVIREDGTIMGGGHLCGSMVVKSQVINATLLASEWQDAYYNLRISSVTTTSNQEILPGINIAEEALEALQGANLQDAGQTNGVAILRAYGEVPAIDIPIRVIMRGDG